MTESEWSSAELFDIKLLLSCLSFIKNSELTSEQLTRLIHSVESVEFAPGVDVFRSNRRTIPALYIVMKGRVILQREGEDPVMVMPGQSFGEQLLTLGEGLDDNSSVDAPFTATAELQARDAIQAVHCGRLTLDSFRKVFAVDDVKKETGDVITARSKRSKKDKHGSTHSVDGHSDDDTKTKSKSKKKKADKGDTPSSPKKKKSSRKDKRKTSIKIETLESERKERSVTVLEDESMAFEDLQSPSLDESGNESNSKKDATCRIAPETTTSAFESPVVLRTPQRGGPREPSISDSVQPSNGSAQEQHDTSLALDDLLEDASEKSEEESDHMDVNELTGRPVDIVSPASYEKSESGKTESPRSFPTGRRNSPLPADVSLNVDNMVDSPVRETMSKLSSRYGQNSLVKKSRPESELYLKASTQNQASCKPSESPIGRVRQEGAQISKSKLAYLEAVSSRSKPACAVPSPASSEKGGSSSSISSSPLVETKMIVTRTSSNSKIDDLDLDISKSKLAYLDAIAQKSPMPSPLNSPTKELLNVSKTKLLYLDAVSRQPKLSGSAGSLELDVDLEASKSHFENIISEMASKTKDEPELAKAVRRIRQTSLKVVPTTTRADEMSSNSLVKGNPSLRRPKAASWKGGLYTSSSKTSGGLDMAPAPNALTPENEDSEALLSASKKVVRKLRQGSWTPNQSGNLASTPREVRKLRQSSLKAFEGKGDSGGLEVHQKQRLRQGSVEGGENPDCLSVHDGSKRKDERETVNVNVEREVEDEEEEMTQPDKDGRIGRASSFDRNSAASEKPLNVRRLRQDSLKAFQGKTSSTLSDRHGNNKIRESSISALESDTQGNHHSPTIELEACSDLAEMAKEDGLSVVRPSDLAARGGKASAMKKANHPADDEKSSFDITDGQKDSATATSIAHPPILSSMCSSDDESFQTSEGNKRLSVSESKPMIEGIKKKDKKKGAKVSFQVGFASFADEAPKFDADESSVDSALHENSDEYRIETLSTPDDSTELCLEPTDTKSSKSEKKKVKKERSHHKKTSKKKERQSSTEYGLKPREKAKEVALANPESVPRRPPANIFQKPLVVGSDYKAPTYDKSDKCRKKISKALSAVYAFQHLEKKEKKKLVSAFEPKHYGSGTEFLKPGETDEFFYVVDDGTVSVEIDGQEAREYSDGDAFGASNLIHSLPNRNKSMRAKSAVNLFRVDQTTYRSIMQLETLKLNSIKRRLLDSVKVFEKVSDKNKQKLADVMKPHVFVKGETIVNEADYGTMFFIIEDGKVRCEDPDLPKSTGQTIERSGFFGETGIVKGDTKPMRVVAKTDVAVYSVERHVFETILGPTRHVIMSEVDARVLSGITCLQFSVAKRLKTEQINDLLAKIEDQVFGKGQTILDSGVEIPAALYFVRKGEANSLKGRMLSVLGPGSVFGSDLFESARDSRCAVGRTAYKVVATERTICGVLRIEDWYTVKKKYFKVKADLHGSDSEMKHEEDLKRRNFEFTNLVKDVLLGEGQFGQVWMVHDETESPPQPYALKIQSKFQLIEEGQADACIREKEALAAMFHPNIIKLYATFQDEHFVYMLLQLLQGGELFNLIHPIDADISVNGLPEEKARFYSFCIADALAHVHSKKYIYRDMKPENVLIDAMGYPVLIDFGFAKKMTEEKTFTLCGTPGYLPPECCLSLGHSYAADHWSFGILIYEMLCGESPFFFFGIDTSELYRSIVQDDFPPLKNSSPEAVAIIDNLLVKDPNFRLGSLAGGESDIISHQWFQGLDVFEMRKKNLKAPWKPEIKDPFDASHFEDWSELQDKTKEKFLLLSEAEAAIFKNF